MIPNTRPLRPFDVGRVVFRNGDIPIVGNVWVPSRIAVGRGHPAIVLVTPGPCLREGIGTDLASLLAEEGYVALAFDPSHQGESGGRPRGLEHPPTRVEDIGCAAEFLSTLPFVDAERIAVLGIGTAGAHAERAARRDRRIRAVGLVSTAAIDRDRRQADGAASIPAVEPVQVASGRSPRPADFAAAEGARTRDRSAGLHPVEHAIESLDAFYRDRFV